MMMMLLLLLVFLLDLGTGMLGITYSLHSPYERFSVFISVVDVVSFSKVTYFYIPMSKWTLKIFLISNIVNWNFSAYYVYTSTYI